MEPLYIVFASAGGVLVLILLALFFVSLDSWKYSTKTKRDIHKAYADENLAKMEYDFAFYNGDLYSRKSRSAIAKQVTIDDVLSGEDNNGEETDDLSRFYPIEEVDDKVVTGHYDPEAVL